MKVQDFIASQTAIVMEGILRTARALPPDKLDWKPAETSRSALSQLAECATSPEILLRVLDGGGYTYTDDLKAKRTAITTLDKAEKILREGTEKLLGRIRELPDSRLEEQVDLPWGATWSLIEVMNMHFWNMTYHVGQINYIQTLLGDTEMHKSA